MIVGYDSASPKIYNIAGCALPCLTTTPRAMFDQLLTAEAVLGRVFRAGKGVKMEGGDHWEDSEIRFMDWVEGVGTNWRMRSTP